MSSSASIDDVQLASYLAGDVDDVTARRIEARLAEDPELGRRLDRVHDALVALRAPDAVEPPSGLAQRLVDATREAEEPAPKVIPLPERRPWFRVAGAVAAAVVGLAVLGGSWLIAPSGEDEAADGDVVTMQEAAEAPAEPDAPAVQDDAAPEADDLSRSAEPFREEEAPLDSFEPEGDVDADAPAIPVAEAAAIADRRWEGFDASTAACREDVEAAVARPAVPLTVTAAEEVGPTTEDERRLLHFDLATARPDGDVLDERTRVVVDAATCEVVEVRSDR